MWNMNFALPTLVLLVIIATAYFSRKRLPVHSTDVFSALLCADMATMLLDYVSTWLDEAGNVNSVLLWIINYLFFAFFIFRSYLYFCFPIELLDSRHKCHRERPLDLLFLIDEAFLLLGSAAGLIFRVQDGMYRSGPLYCFINIQFFIWIVLSLLMTIRIHPERFIRKTPLYLYFFILMLGIVLRMCMPHLLVMNLFCMFAIEIVYLFYLNPDQYIDEATLLFNRRGWEIVSEEIITHHQFSLVGFGIVNYVSYRESRGNEKLSHERAEIGNWILHQFPDLSSFYIGSGVFILSSTHSFDQNEVLGKIEERFKQPWHTNDSEYYLHINEMIMKPQSINDNSLLIKTLADAGVILTQSQKVETLQIDATYMQKIIRRDSIQKQLAQAVLHQSFSLFLQPIINAKTNTLEGAEALCRLEDGKGGYFFPDEFLPLAMKSGYIDALGHQMMEKACAFMAREEVHDRNLKWINVNVAPEQFRNPNLLNDFLNILDHYHLDPSIIHLEVTEESMIDRALLHDSMSKFREKGFIFAMDDFGSSYSNMIRLQQNHFSCVKVDKDFTWSHFREKTALLPDIIKTSHDMQMKVVIEGVETKEMVKELREMHCDYLQGFYYSRPIPAEDFLHQFIA